MDTFFQSIDDFFLGHFDLEKTNYRKIYYSIKILPLESILFCESSDKILFLLSNCISDMCRFQFH